MLKNSYYYFTNIFTSNECNDIISYGKNAISDMMKNNNNEYKATVWEQSKKAKISLANKTYEQVKNKTKKIGKDLKQEVLARSGKVAWITDKWIYDRVKTFVDYANNQAGWSYEYDSAESIQFTVYEKGDFYTWHTDGFFDKSQVYTRFIPGVTQEPALKHHTINNKWVGKTRKISMTVNLSDENSYEGGDLMFDLGPHTPEERYVKVSQIKKQGSLCVFPSFVHHQVTPITKGTRYSLVIWFLGRPFK